ncbi:hypothetical protein APA_1670 [Pseudanabaena sp. lw0831]|nr:hypothetical protein APA_1670 [Pseudanabaena sp. lw0831]
MPHIDTLSKRESRRDSLLDKVSIAIISTLLIAHNVKWVISE